jgi:Ca2+-binding EF-hand superfamily protein
MNRHRSLIEKRMGCVKQKTLTEDQLKLTLNTIFREYDEDKNGSMSIEEFRDMLNAIYARKTGNPSRYSSE